MLRAPEVSQTDLALVVDMEQEERHRLPESRFARVGPVDVPLLLGGNLHGLALAVNLILRHGRYHHG